MATVTINLSLLPISVTGSQRLIASSTSTAIGLPTDAGSTPPATRVLITNLGASQEDAYVVLGVAGVTAAVGEGVAVPPGTTQELAIGANTELATITAASTATLQIATGF